MPFKKKSIGRRALLRYTVAGGAAASLMAALGGCGETQVVTETKIQEVVREVPVEKVVTQIVERDRPVEVEKVVEVERVVTKTVKEVVVEVQEKVVTKVVEVEKPKPQALTLIFSTWWPLEMVGHGVYTQKYIDVYQAKYPHVTIEYRNWPFGEYHTKLLTQAAAGTAPDVFAYSGIFFPKFVKAGGAYPIDELVRTDAEFEIEDFVEQSLRLSIVDGRLWGIPHIGNAWAVLYNQQVLEEAGVEDINEMDAAGRWNWETHLETLQKITTRDDAGKAERIGMNDPGLNVLGIHSWAWQNGGNLLNQPGLGEFVLNEPAGVAAVEWAADLVRNHQVAASPADAFGNSYAELNNGRFGMIYGWAIYSRVKGFPVDVAHPPSGPAAQTTVFHPNTLGIAAKTKFPEESWNLIALQLSKQGDLDQTKIMGVISRRKSNLLKMAEVVKGQFGIGHPEVVAQVIENGRTFDVTEFQQEIGNAITPVLQQIREGDEAQTKLDELKPVVDDILAPRRG